MLIPAGELRTESDQEHSNKLQHPEPGDQDDVRRAMLEIRRAAQSRHVDNICGAYNSLRRAMAGRKIRDLFDAVTAALGPTGMAIVVSSYSHRKCFMCDHGTVVCDQCDGKRRLPSGKICQTCEGLAVTPCTFCLGTGWADREIIPDEIRTVVVDKQFLHTRADLDKLINDNPEMAAGRAIQMPFMQRRSLVLWLMRLHARLSNIAQSGDPAAAQHQQELGKALDQIAAMQQTLSTAVDEKSDSTSAM